MNTTTKAAHTSTPWRLKTYPGCLKHSEVYGPPHPVDGGDFAALASLTNPADAAHIVRCVNAWDSIEQLRARLAELESNQLPESSTDAALAQAKGQS